MQSKRKLLQFLVVCSTNLRKVPNEKLMFHEKYTSTITK